MSKLKPFLGVVVGIAALALGGEYFLHRGAAMGNTAAGSAPQAGPPPAMPVPVALVVKRSIPIYLEYSARTESIRNVALQAKVPGYIKAQPASDGADVKEGDLLYKIEDRDYRAVLDQAKGQAQRDAAALDYARATYGRGDELNRSGYIAKDSLEQRGSSVRQSEAALVIDRAAVDAAQSNVSYTEIRAPFSGRVGRDRAPVGTLVGSAGTTLNTVVQLDPIYVTFNPSESDLREIQKAQKSSRLKADVLLPGDIEARYNGDVTFIDNSVDHATGTISTRATIRNADFTLLPGQYVRVRVRIGMQPNATLVPQSALGSSQLGKYVFLVGPDNKAEQRAVSLGGTEGELVAVTGVSEGEQIITGNLQKIGPGAPVQPLPQKQASN
jgi:multidrug efflux system membrane fusion protein